MGLVNNGKQVFSDDVTTVVNRFIQYRQSDVDTELRNIRNDIRVTKSRILLKHLIRKHKILKDVERSTSFATGFVL